PPMNMDESPCTRRIGRPSANQRSPPALITWRREGPSGPATRSKMAAPIRRRTPPTPRPRFPAPCPLTPSLSPVPPGPSALCMDAGLAGLPRSRSPAGVVPPGAGTLESLRERRGGGGGWGRPDAGMCADPVPRHCPPVAHEGGARMTALAQPGSWRAQLLATPAPHRRRLPSDVVAALLGAAMAAAGWLAVAAGVGTPVAPHLGAAVSWLVTLVAVGGTSAFLGVTAFVCALAGRWVLIARLIVAVGVAAVGCVAVAHGLGAGPKFAPPPGAPPFPGPL